MTMDLLGLKREDLIDGLEEPIGAATALLEMRDAADPALHLARRPLAEPAVARRARMLRRT